MVCLFKKSLYDLKQSLRQWYLRFDQFMSSHGYNRSQYDSCVYYRNLATYSYIYLLLYVDDMLIACNQRETIEGLKMQLITVFEMKDLSTATKILGMQIVRDRPTKTLFLTQVGYVKKVLNRFIMEYSKPVLTPLSAHFKLFKLQEPTTDADIEYIKKIPYSNAVGSVMYAMVCSRPNITYGVGVVSRFMGNLDKEHLIGVKWILRYLKGSSNHGILFGNVDGATYEVAGFVDSDFEGDLDKKRSITGFVLTMCGGDISWKAFLQSVVALSKIEAEYIALTEVVNEAVQLRSLVSQLDFKQEIVTISCDSSSAIQLSKNPKYHERTKHIDVRLHFIREEISSGVVNVVKIPYKVNPTDILTKLLPAVKFMNSLYLIGLGNM